MIRCDISNKKAKENKKTEELYKSLRRCYHAVSEIVDAIERNTEPITLATIPLTKYVFFDQISSSLASLYL